MKFMIPLLAAGSSLFAYDSYIDCQVTANPYDLRGQTHIDITAPHVFYHEQGSVIFTPELTSYVGSNTDIGFSLAKKHLIGPFTVGSHIFYDRSSFPGGNFHHVGSGIFVGTDHFEFTSNYYHPLSPGWSIPAIPMVRADAFVKPCKWIDSEFQIKSPWFQVGTGPIYNFDYKEVALHSRLIVPTERCTFSLGGMMSESGFCQGFISVSFSLMKNPSSSMLSTPLNRTKKCSVAYQNISVIRSRQYDKYIRQNEQLITLPPRG